MCASVGKSGLISGPSRGLATITDAGGQRTTVSPRRRRNASAVLRRLEWGVAASAFYRRMTGCGDAGALLRSEEQLDLFNVSKPTMGSESEPGISGFVNKGQTLGSGKALASASGLSRLLLIPEVVPHRDVGEGHSLLRD